MEVTVLEEGESVVMGTCPHRGLTTSHRNWSLLFYTARWPEPKVGMKLSRSGK